MAFSAKVIFSAVDNVTAPVRGMQMSVAGFANSASMGFGSMAGASKGFASKLDGLSSKMISFKGILAAGIIGEGVKKLYELAKSTAEAYTQQQLLSDRMGIGLENLQELSFAAKEAGINQELFSKSLGRFAKSMGELKMNTGKLTSYLRLNDSALLKNLHSSKSVEQSFGLFADKISKIHDPLKRAALTTMVFGRGAANITNMLMHGSKGLEEARKRYIEYHGALTLSKDAIRDFHESQVNLNAAMGGIKDTIGTSLIPAFSGLISSVAKAIAKNREMIATQIKGFLSGFADGLKFVVNHLNIILPLLEWYIKTIVLLKVVSMAAKLATVAFTIVQYALAAAMFATSLVTGKTTVAMAANAAFVNISKYAYLGLNAVLWLYSAAQAVGTAAAWAFSAALWSTGIPEIVIAIAALAVGIYEMATNWDECTKSITNWYDTAVNYLAQFLHPLKMVGDYVDYLGQRFDNLGAQFKKGFGNGILEVGKMLLSVILHPLEWAVKIIAHLTGSSWAADAAKGIGEARSYLDKNTEVAEKPVNKDAAVLNQKKILESKQTQNVQINIDDSTGRARATGQTTPIPVKVNSTRGYGGSC
jgi:hypothetical protein